MKNTLKCIMVSVMMLVTILPITALATTIRQQADTESTGIFDHTTVRGFAIYLGMSSSGTITRLFAIRLHYTTVSPSGEIDFGVIRLKRVDIPTKMIGYQGHYYMIGSFRGSVVF
jgi:hypothetical protein